jgi:hypothetical protein
VLNNPSNPVDVPPDLRGDLGKAGSGTIRRKLIQI